MTQLLYEYASNVVKSVVWIEFKSTIGEINKKSWINFQFGILIKNGLKMRFEEFDSNSLTLNLN